MAAGEGFEPSHTESESAVLPLHNPARHGCHYTRFYEFVKGKEKIIFGWKNREIPYRSELLRASSRRCFRRIFRYLARITLYRITKMA